MVCGVPVSMEPATRLKKLGRQLANVLEEVGNQIKEHAIKASEDLGNLTESAGVFCNKYSNPLRECNCTLLVNKNDEIVYEEQSQHTAAVLRENGAKSVSTNALILSVESGGSAIIVTTSKGALSEISIEWFRKYSSKDSSKVIGAISERYILSADDVGAILIVKVNSNSNTFQNEIGPFDIDIITRKKIENYLIGGTAIFNLELYNKPGSDDTLNPTPNHLSKIQPTFQSNRISKVILKASLDYIALEDQSYKDIITAKYESTYPLITLDVHSSNFELCFNKNRRLNFRAISKYDRDIIVLTIRAFHGKKLMANSLNLNSSEGLSFQVTLSKLNTDLCNAINVCEQVKNDLERVKREKDELEKEIAETITSFQEVQISEKRNVCRDDNDKSVENKLADALSENNRLDKLTQSQKADLERALKEIGVLQSKIAKLASL